MGGQYSNVETHDERTTNRALPLSNLLGCTLLKSEVQKKSTMQTNVYGTARRNPR